MTTLLHVVSGTVVLGVAPAALAVRKGGAWHRRFGRAFTWSMALVLLTAGFMWQAKNHVFLMPLAIVSGYLIYDGWRVVARRRRRTPDPMDDTVDVLAALASCCSGAWLFVLAATARDELMRELVPVLIGLGALAIVFALNDLRGIFVTRTRIGWLLAHLSAMLAAYISAVTAFVVINAHQVPMLLRWAVPSAIGTAIITGYSVRERLRVRSAARRAAAARAAAG